ncbi:hypothetical protein BDV59DRAFT_176048 [Aspergillus ambiguus]|uniref:uncharacterized protein n=1 Tax=Aspergillus ambiguus TaxID=176160 RepID=UPI003CCE279F
MLHYCESLPQCVAIGVESKSSMGENVRAKPWSSGRVLSRSQRDRKRIMNRASQSRRREALKHSLNCIEQRLSHIEHCCLAPLSSPLHHGRPVLSPEFPRLTLYADSSSDISLSDFLNGMLGDVRRFNNRQVCTDDYFNQDALIRGVIRGWTVLQTEYFTCPIWTVLSRIDALLMAEASVATRLALLRGIHLMLLSCIFPDCPPVLPAWFRPRASQALRSHDAVINYFAWPAFRERLITSNYPQLDNRFWFYFTRNIQFQWPFPSAHTIDMDSNSGKFHFSNSFRDATDSIGRFKMGPEFFHIYPDCWQDINAPYNV